MLRQLIPLFFQFEEIILRKVMLILLTNVFPNLLLYLLSKAVSFPFFPAFVRLRKIRTQI